MMWPEFDSCCLGYSPKRPPNNSRGGHEEEKTLQLIRMVCSRTYWMVIMALFIVNMLFNVTICYLRDRPSSLICAGTSSANHGSQRPLELVSPKLNFAQAKLKVQA